MVDMNRDSDGIYLPPTVSAEIWQDTQNASVIQQLATQVNLPGSGLTIQTITGDPVAEWVNETEEKPVGDSTFGSKAMTPYKAAIIELFSNEFRRDLATLYTALQGRLPGTLAQLFDSTVLFGPAPGSDFDTFTDVPSVSLGGTGEVYGNLLGSLESVAIAGEADISSFVVSPQGEIKVLGELDGNGRPLFTMNPQTDGAIGALLGRNVFKSPNVYDAASGTVGFAGDWGSARWGSVEGIRVAMSDQTTINKGGQQIHLWQRNMFAVRVEVEYGFIFRDANRFVRLTDTTGDGGGGES